MDPDESVPEESGAGHPDGSPPLDERLERLLHDLDVANDTPRATRPAAGYDASPGGAS